MEGVKNKGYYLKLNSHYKIYFNKFCINLCNTISNQKNFNKKLILL